VPYLKEAPLSTTIKRGPLPTDHFTIISNDWVRDSSLSWAARGLLAWLASHADGYRITEEGIISAGPSGRAAAKVMIKDLEEAGYLRRERTPIVTGGSTVDYILTGRESENRTLGNVRKSNPRADQEEQDVSAGGSNSGKSNPRSYTEDQKKTNTKTSSSLRATRVPDNFWPDDSMRAWFEKSRLNEVINGPTEHEKFMDYFRAAPGIKGRKTDWPATWRNWMRNAAERADRRPGTALMMPPSGRPNALDPMGVPYKPSTTDQRVGQAMALAAKYEEQGL
jgi:hypothetical protein